MKTQFLIIAMLLFTFFATHAQSIAGAAEDTTAYTVVEQMPEFPGGIATMRRYIAENVQYPAAGSCENDLTTSCYVRFIVEKTGKVRNVSIAHTSRCETFDLLFIRLIQSLPDFKPGKQNGKPVNVYMTTPIHINPD